MITSILSLGSKELRLSYLAIAILVTYIFSAVFQLSLTSIFGIVASLYIIHEVYEFFANKTDERNMSIKEKLDFLNMVLEQNTQEQYTLLGLRRNTYIKGSESVSQIGSYLYLDPDMVNLLYSVKEFEQYNDESYANVIRLTNYVLKLLDDMRRIVSNSNKDIPLGDCPSSYVAAQKLENTACNYFHSFVYSLPVNPLYRDRYMQALQRYRLLMKRVLIEMREICVKQADANGVNASTPFISRFEGLRDYAPVDGFDWFLQESIN